MHFEVRFNNGYWKLFDARGYKDVQRFDSKKEAYAALARRSKK